MERSRRGNYKLDWFQQLEIEPCDGGDELKAAEAEWVAQWEPTVPVTAREQHSQRIVVQLDRGDLLIVLRSRRPQLRIELVA
jgi:hypothetical protein